MLIKVTEICQIVSKRTIFIKSNRLFAYPDIFDKKKAEKRRKKNTPPPPTNRNRIDYK